MRSAVRILVVILVVMRMSAIAKGEGGAVPINGAKPLHVIEQLPPITIQDEFGRPVQMQNERRWKPMCGSDTTNMDQNAFEDIVAKAKESLTGPVTVISGGAERGGAFNVVFN